MGDTNGRKIKHFLKRLTWHRKKSCKRCQKAIEWYILVLKKEQKLGSADKWVVKTKANASARLKKYGISMDKIKEILESRGQTDLLSNVG